MADTAVNWMQIDHCIRLLELGPGMRVVDVSPNGLLHGALLTMVGPGGQVWVTTKPGPHLESRVRYLDEGNRPDDQTVDRAVGYGALSRWADVSAELGEIKRMLVRGGRLVLGEGGRCYNSLFGDGPPNRLRRMLVAAGYADIRIEDSGQRLFVTASRL